MWVGNNFDPERLEVTFNSNNNPVDFSAVGSSFALPENQKHTSNPVGIADIEFNDNWVALLGDIHGNVPSLQVAAEVCSRLNIKHCFQLGDFGYRFASKYGKNEEQMDALLKSANEEFGFALHVIDGNHDNHEYWHRNRAEAAPRGLYWIDDTAQWVYHPRGSIFQLYTEGGFDTQGIEYAPKLTKFGFLGGARSVNVLPSEEEILEGNGWWYDEEPTDEDVQALISNSAEIGGIDVLLTHEAPSAHYLTKGLSISLQMEALSSVTRHRVYTAMKETSPALLAHGHWHQFAATEYIGSNVLTLPQEYQYANVSLVNLDTLEIVVPSVSYRIGIDDNVNYTVG